MRADAATRKRNPFLRIRRKGFRPSRRKRGEGWKTNRHIRRERRRVWAEDSPLCRGRDDGEPIGVGTDLLQVEAPELREEGGERHERLLREARRRCEGV